MRESRLSGSVEGVMSDHDSYSDSRNRLAVYRNGAKELNPTLEKAALGSVAWVKVN